MVVLRVLELVYSDSELAQRWYLERGLSAGDIVSFEVLLSLCYDCETQTISNNTSKHRD